MKKNLKFLIFLIIGLGIGYYFGIIAGERNEMNANYNQSIESSRIELLRKENEQIKSLLKVNAKIQRIDEGGLFKKKIKYYLVGEIINTSLIAKAKDIKLKITFLSKTKSVTGSSEFTVYEIIHPKKSKTFKKSLSISNDVSDFKLEITNALPQY